MHLQRRLQISQKTLKPLMRPERTHFFGEIPQMRSQTKFTHTLNLGDSVYAQTAAKDRKEYGGLKVDQARRLKELEQENMKLKRLDSPEKTATSRALTR